MGRFFNRVLPAFLQIFLFWPFSTCYPEKNGIYMAKKMTLEEAFDALDGIIDELQGGELTLEESFKKYEEGMKLVKNCNDSIDKVEKKLLVINGGEDEAVRG